MEERRFSAASRPHFDDAIPNRAARPGEEPAFLSLSTFVDLSKTGNQSMMISGRGLELGNSLRINILPASC